MKEFVFFSYFCDFIIKHYDFSPAENDFTIYPLVETSCSGLDIREVSVKQEGKKQKKDSSNNNSESDKPQKERQDRMPASEVNVDPVLLHVLFWSFCTRLVRAGWLYELAISR